MSFGNALRLGLGILISLLAENIALARELNLDSLKLKSSALQQQPNNQQQLAGDIPKYVEETEPMSQVNSVSQLSDVQHKSKVQMS